LPYVLRDRNPDFKNRRQIMAMMTRWDPFRDLQRVQDEMNRLFDDRLVPRNAGESVGWTPKVDIFEDEEGVSLRFELAGVEPKDVDIRFENGVLTLRGERKLEREEKRDNYHRVELSYGTFTRSFSLPATIDAEKIRAESKNGVLTVHLPKKPEAKPKSIQVKVS
jgi:HSP20 family protein